jgi:glycosyltransferase involved in cell wall biosynthesis
MVSLLKRWQLQAEDTLKYNPLVRGAVSRYQRWTTAAANGDQQVLAGSIQQLCAAARFTGSEAAKQAIASQLRDRLGLLRPKEVDWSRFADHLTEPVLPRSVLLKPWLSPREKGVLFVSFEKEWFRLLLHCDLQAFSDRYNLVVAPSGDPHNLLNCVFAAAYPGKVITLISNASDLAVLPRLAPNFVAVPLYASNWVLPTLFEARTAADRDVDLIMVANFAKFKRHLTLFAALRNMDRRLRVLLIGQHQDGRTAETIRREAACYGVADRFTVQSNVSYPGVTQALCRARASVILSRREGSCVAIAESLFAGAPAALLESAAIGSRAFINPATGVFLQDHRVARQLTDLIARAESFSPRQWAEENISCFHSSQKLNAIVREQAVAAGGEWTQDIATLCWRPDPALVHMADVERMQPARAEMKQQWGLEVGPSPDEPPVSSRRG